jgi:hypothetical protein
MKQFLAVTCSLLLILTTPSLRANDKDMVLEAGKSAPFKGVLVPEPHYRAYSEAIAVAEFYKTAPLAECEDSSLDTRDYLLAGAGGLVIGLVVGAFVARK